MITNLEFLKKLLSVPSKTYNEELMVNFIKNWLTENNIDFFVDEYNNIYAEKTDQKTFSEDFYFPCVVAHTDTVHSIDSINVKEEYLKNAQGELKLSLKAYNDEGNPTGIGGDDKCGIFACLTLLEKLPNLKAAFFVSEETGCHGSKKANKDFFKNVGYIIEFDAPENWMVSEICAGVRLFDRDSDFYTKCDEVLCSNMDLSKFRYMSHPYTDVYALRKLFDVSCINFSIGYYQYHTREEYIVLEDLSNGIKIGEEMINNLGCKLYHKKVHLNSNDYYLF